MDTGYFIHANGPFFNAKRCAHFNESKEIRFSSMLDKFVMSVGTVPRGALADELPLPADFARE